MMEAAEAAEAARPPGHSGRTALFWFFKIAVSGGLLYLLLRRMDTDRLWATMRTASLPWMAAALLLYLGMLLISSWRWGLLLAAQHIGVSFGALTRSYLVATFANNFLPSNIGGDVVRIGDTAGHAGSKTQATMIVLVDRGIGLLGLIFVAAVGATITAAVSPIVGPIVPLVLWAVLAVGVAALGWAVMVPHGPGTLLKPLRAIHQEWVGERLEKLTQTFAKFRNAPGALLQCFVGSLGVQIALVIFYAMIAKGLHVDIPIAYLGVVVPLSFIVLMLPISVNGLGVRELTFATYLSTLGVARSDAVALSFMSYVLIMIFSMSGAVAYLTRRR